MINGINTNIKNLPEGKYWTEYLYSDKHAWREVKRTAKTAVLEIVEVERDPDWKMVSYPGGFAHHVANNRSQTWLFHHFGPRCIRIYKTKRGWMRKGTRFAEDLAFHFYDYNF